MANHLTIHSGRRAVSDSHIVVAFAEHCKANTDLFIFMDFIILEGRNELAQTSGAGSPRHECV